MLLKNYWLILTLIVFIKLIKDKELSTYNIKWLVLYAVYVVFMQAEYDFDWKNKYFTIEEFVWVIFLIPLCSYLLFSVFYRKIQNWKIIKWADHIIDIAYCRIKELC